MFKAEHKSKPVSGTGTSFQHKALGTPSAVARTGPSTRPGSQEGSRARGRLSRNGLAEERSSDEVGTLLAFALAFKGEQAPNHAGELGALLPAPAPGSKS